jgi:hypothetical protein
MKRKTPNAVSGAKKTAVCQFCGRRFTNRQSVRAHLKGCLKYRRVRQFHDSPSGKTEICLKSNSTAVETASGSAQDQAPRRPGPDSQESRLLRVDTYEVIQQLCHVAEEIVIAAQLSQVHQEWLARNARGARLAYDCQGTPPEEWSKLHQAICNVERDFDRMVGRLQLDRNLLFGIYHRLRAIRDTWLLYRENDQRVREQRRAPGCVEDSETRKMMEEDRITCISQHFI